MAWGIAFGFIFWHNIPTAQTMLGAGIIILSGIYLLKYKQH
jgi:drug/metabolite transporter (DMT)-like permease